MGQLFELPIIPKLCKTIHTHTKNTNTQKGYAFVKELLYVSPSTNPMLFRARMRQAKTAPRPACRAQCTIHTLIMCLYFLFNNDNSSPSYFTIVKITDHSVRCTLKRKVMERQAALSVSSVLQDRLNFSIYKKMKIIIIIIKWQQASDRSFLH